MGYKLAVDFGTTNSVIAHWDDAARATRVIHIPGLSLDSGGAGQSLIPSLLYVQDGRTGLVILGQAVRQGGLDHRHDNRLFRNFKRGITAGHQPESRLIDGVPWTDQEAGRCFLRRLVGALPFTAADIESLIVTAPVAAFDGYVTWLSEAVPGVNPDQIRIIDESTAAALGYAVNEPRAVVLVCDFGGGTLDLSLVQLPESRDKTGGLLGWLRGKDTRQNAARVIAKAGVTLGGSDVDQWLLAEVLRRAGLSVDALGNDYAALLTACERAKIALSTDLEAEVAFDAAGSSYQVPFTRAELEAMMQANGFYLALRQVVDKVMSGAHQRGIYKEDVNFVLLVGGVSLTPSVQQTLKSYFKDMAVRLDKPFTAIAEGALQVAAGYGLEDRLAHSYGLRYLDLQTGKHRFDEIVPMGSRYPTAKPVRVVLGAAHPAQAAVEFVIGQVQTDAVSTVEVKYEDGQAVFIAQADQGAQQVFLLNDPAEPLLQVPLDPPGRPGEDRLQAEFSLDDQRRLRLSATDLQTGRELLHNVVVATLGKGQMQRSTPAPPSGLEPCQTSYAQPGKQRLTLRGLATMLNLLSPDAVSLETLVEALHSPEFYVRYSAAEMLGRRGDRDARRIVQECLDHGEVPLRASVALHLYRFNWFTAEALVRQALKDPDERVRESAVYGLCHLRGVHGYQLLLEALPAEGDNVRRAAAWGLSKSPDAGAVPVLEIVIQARDPEIRQDALEDLGATESPEALPAVRRALDDPDLDVRYHATLSLIELAGEDCFPELAQRIENSQGPERLRYVRGFFHATNYRLLDVGKSSTAGAVITALQAATCDGDPAVHAAAAMPLAWTRHPLAAEALSAAYYREMNADVKARMLNAAVNLMSPVAPQLLQDGLASPDLPVRRAAEYLAARNR